MATAQSWKNAASPGSQQRQRIAIARALVNDPKIQTFDEAPFTLHPETEAAIQQNMKRIIEGRTTTIIAHRETAVKECGRVVRLGGHSTPSPRGPIKMFYKLPPFVDLNCIDDANRCL
ncbi:MAG: hypothetical protein R3C97_16550 [Geminicoccaceae bacterium]